MHAGKIWMGALFAVFAIGLTSPARAELMILESEVPGLKKGQIVSDNTTIEIPEGASLKVILPNGKITRLSGPSSGKAKDLTGGGTGGVVAALRDILKKGGGAKKKIGATRGFAVQSDEDAYESKFSWDVIPAHAEGHVCVPANLDLKLGRPPIGTVSSMTIVDTANDTKAVVRWRDGDDKAPWPRAFPPEADKNYFFLVSRLPVRQVMLRKIDGTLPDEETILSVLYEQDCRFQIDTWLKERGIALE